MAEIRKEIMAEILYAILSWAAVLTLLLSLTSRKFNK